MHNPSRSARVIALVGVLAASSGALLHCSDRGDRPNARGGGPGVIRNGLSDSDVAGALAAIQTSEIEQAQLARDRAHSPGVRWYANEQAEQATHAGHEQDEMLDRMRLAPSESPLSRQLMGESVETLRGLSQESGPRFDRAFLASQVRTTERALSVVDGLLIPNAQRPELRQKLENTRATLMRRLSETQRLLRAFPNSTPVPEIIPRGPRGP